MPEKPLTKLTRLVGGAAMFAVARFLKLFWLDLAGTLVVGEVVDTHTRVTEDPQHGATSGTFDLTYRYPTSDGRWLEGFERIEIVDGVRRPQWGEPVAVVYAGRISTVL